MTLGNGLYTLDRSLADAMTTDRPVYFIKASIKGWDYAIKNQSEAVMIVLHNDTSGSLTEVHQTSIKPDQVFGKDKKLSAPRG